MIASCAATNIPQWQTLEDLAIQENQNTPKYQFVLREKGQDEVENRKAFIGVEKATVAQ